MPTAHQHERLVSYLRRATDEDLEQLSAAQERAAAQALAGVDWKTMDEFPPSFLTLVHFEASVAAEQTRRTELLRHAEAELGHQPEVWPYLDVGSTP